MKILVCFQDFITNTFTYTLHTNGFFIYFLKHLILVLRASKHKLNFLASSSCWHLDLHFHHVFTRYNQLLSSCIMNFLLLGKHLVFLFTLIFEKKKKLGQATSSFESFNHCYLLTVRRESFALISAFTTSSKNSVIVHLGLKFRFS